MQDVGLWHERDISHSSVERIILPDSTILLDYMHHLALRVVRGLVIDPDRMRENLELTHGALFSQPLLLALVGAGMPLDDAYRLVQAAAQRAWGERRPLRELLADEPAVADLDLDAVFDPAQFTRYAEEIVGRLDAID